MCNIGVDKVGNILCKLKDKEKRRLFAYRDCMLWSIVCDGESRCGNCKYILDGEIKYCLINRYKVI